jgi:hypothetical protein
MFTENTLALLALVAVSIAGTGGGAGRFAAGIGSLLTVLFGEGFRLFGTALGFGTFMIIVLTVTQLVFRVMRVTLSEWAGDVMPALKNLHVSTIVSMVLTMLLVLTGTWVYLWQLFGAANQLMAALSLLIVTVWTREKRILLCALANAVHVHHHVGRHARYRAQPLCDHRPERRLGRGGSLGHDRDRPAPVRDRAGNRLGWLPGLPALLQGCRQGAQSPGGC